MRTVCVTLQDLAAAVAATAGPLFVVVDVGATNVRVGCRAGGLAPDAELRFAQRRAGSVAGLVAVLCEAEAALGDDVRRVAAAAVAVPGPVVGGCEAVLANYAAADTAGRTLRASLLPRGLCPPARTSLLNDLEAAATGVAALSAARELPRFFAPMWGAGGTAGSAEALPAEGNVLVLAPGTGLGNALLIMGPRRRGGGGGGPPIVLPLEFGHTTAVAGHDAGLLAAYGAELGYAAEFDDLCSGRGLERIYRHCAGPGAGGRALDAAAISGLSQRGDAEARRAVALYFRFLMGLASQLTMGLQLRAVVVCGDNAVHNAHYLADPEGAREMRAALLAHSMERMGFMSRVAVLRQHTSVNLNLAGCVYDCANRSPSSKL